MSDEYFNEKFVRAEQEIATLQKDKLTSAKNLCWMAEKIHQGYHTHAVGSWKICTTGVCGSMEHMLAEVGLDKDLREIKRAP